MKSKTRALALFFTFLFACTGYSKTSEIIVLMDASGTILPWFEQINGKILSEISKKFVRQGDTFHLISFNSRVNLEIVQPINTEEDISRIVSRFMLLYPIGQNSDFLSGLQYTVQYAGTLDQSNKIHLIIISDGIFNPPQSSPYYSFSAEQINAEISLLSRKIRSSGWSVYYLKLPFPENAEIVSLDGSSLINIPNETTSEKQSIHASSPASNEKSQNSKNSVTTQQTTDKEQESISVHSDTDSKKYKDISAPVASSLHIQPSYYTDSEDSFIETALSIPEVTFPDNLGTKGRSFALPLIISNKGTSSIHLELNAVTYDGVNILEKNSFLKLGKGQKATLKVRIRLPPAIPNGDNVLPVQLQFSENQRVLPDTGLLKVRIVPYSFENFIANSRSFLLVASLLLLGSFFIGFLILILLHRTSNPAVDALRKVQAENAYSSETTTTHSVGNAKHLRNDAKPANPLHGALTIDTMPSSSGMLPTKDKSHQSSISHKQYGVSYFKSLFATKRYSGNIAPTEQQTAPGSSYQNMNNLTTAEGLNRISVKSESKTRTSIVPGSRDNTHEVLESMSRVHQDEIKERNALLSQAIEQKKIPSSTIIAASSNELIPVKNSSKVLLKLHVSRQNPHIGKRNTHLLKPGSRLSIGGGTSSFLIFLVKIPQNIAEVRWDGQDCSLAILKPRYFPFEKESIIHDCLNKTFTVVSDKNYVLDFELQQYEDPVIALNRLLRSIDYA